MTHAKSEDRQRQRAPSKRSLETRARILDAAEAIFAAQGYDGASIRDIAEKAGVQKAHVNFHGGSKEALFARVVERRAQELSQCRLERLRSFKKDKGTLSVRDILSCFIEPYLEKAENEGAQWRAYARLIAHVSADERWAPISRACFDPTAQVFIEELCALHPDADRMAVSAAFVYTVAAMLAITTSSWRIDALGQLPERGERPDFAERTAHLLRFCEGGFHAVLEESESASRSV